MKMYSNPNPHSFTPYLYPPIFTPPYLPLPPAGLKEVQDKVSNYSSLMKDFPVHELHGANDLESIKAAVVLIYTHMRKMRTTTYPAQRAIHLIEAISRDLNAQLLKVRLQSMLAIVGISIEKLALD